MSLASTIKYAENTEIYFFITTKYPPIKHTCGASKERRTQDDGASLHTLNLTGEPSLAEVENRKGENSSTETDHQGSGKRNGIIK